MNKPYDVYLCKKQYRLNETEKQLAYSEPPYISPFDRMPSKIETQGMKEIFKREYCGRFEVEESV